VDELDGIAILTEEQRRAKIKAIKAEAKARVLLAKSAALGEEKASDVDDVLELLAFIKNQYGANAISDAIALAEAVAAEESAINAEIAADAVIDLAADEAAEIVAESFPEPEPVAEIAKEFSQILDNAINDETAEVAAEIADENLVVGNDETAVTDAAAPTAFLDEFQDAYLAPKNVLSMDGTIMGETPAPETLIPVELHAAAPAKKSGFSMLADFLSDLNTLISKYSSQISDSANDKPLQSVDNICKILAHE
jgi:hypothetical protein